MKSQGLIMLLLALSQCTSSPAAEQLVQTTILADVDAIQPGSTFTIGVLFAIRPEWHIYWKYPGDAGAPTLIRFVPPQGFRIGPVRWPVPATFRQPGDIVGYGYTDTVLLAAQVTAPDIVPESDPVVIKAEVSWLCCRDICVPGRSTLELALPIGPARDGKHRPLFRLWDTRLPVPADLPDSPARVSSRGRLAGSDWAELEIRVNWQAPASQVQWIPELPPALELRRISVQTDAGASTVTFQARLLRGQELNQDDLAGVLAYTDREGQRRGLSVRVPLKSALQER